MHLQLIPRLYFIDKKYSLLVVNSLTKIIKTLNDVR